MNEQDAIRVADHAQKHRYEVWIGDERAGIAAYTDNGLVRTFTHTRIFPSFEGRGLANRIATFALDDVRARGLKVVPECPFFAQFFETHAEYRDLLR